MAAGVMPNLARLERSGSGGALLTETPPLSPLLWTTMMTGRSPLEHRILDFVQFDPRTGRKVPITSGERRVPAVWELANAAGRPSAVFGLWATYPAPESTSLVVTNAFVSARGALPRALEPAGAAAWAEPAREAARAGVDLAAMRELLPDLSEAEWGRATSVADPFAEVVPGLYQLMVQTEIVRRLTLAGLERQAWSLAVVYVEGTDTIGHLLAPFASPPLAGVSQDDARRFASVPERYFARIDRWIGELDELARRRGAVLMIASDHGFEWGEGRPRALSSAGSATAAQWHRKAGIYLLTGPGVAARPGHRGTAGVAQVAATLLALVGLGPTPEMAPALSEVGAIATLPRAPEIDLAESSQALPFADASGVADEEAVRKLRALGYLGGAVESPTLKRPHGTRTAASFSNEAQILERLGRLNEAADSYRKALEQEPDDLAARLNWSRLLFDSAKEPALSDRLLLEAFLGGVAEGEPQIAARSAAWRERGRSDRAQALLDAALAGAPRSALLRLGRGRLRIEQEDCRGAAADFAAAVEVDPERPGAWAALATARLCLGDRTAAREAFSRALALAPEREDLRRAMAALESADLRR